MNFSEKERNPLPDSYWVCLDSFKKIKYFTLRYFVRYVRSNIRLILAACLLFSFSFSFSQSQTFKSSKITINDYGNKERTSTINPNIVTLNLKDSLITIEPQHDRINEFLSHQNQFTLTRSFGSGTSTKVYFTSSEYIFTFDSKMRVIVISKKDVSPKVHSVWLEEIDSKD